MKEYEFKYYLALDPAPVHIVERRRPDSIHKEYENFLGLSIGFAAGETRCITM